MTAVQKLAEQFPEAKNTLPFIIFFNPDCLLHDVGPNHPECSERLEAIIEGCLALDDKDSINFHFPPSATITQLTILHPEDYLLRLEEACLSGQPYFMSGDNPICPDSFKAILAAGGLAIELGKHLVAGSGGFALTRPPGHHAGKKHAEGFCFLNHIGLVIEVIREDDPEARILVVDFDVHHGNGTSSIYWKYDSIFFFSIHGSPASIYPRTGWEYEQGEEAGQGYTLNAPMPLGTTGGLWLKTFLAHLQKCTKDFNPEYILVSAGFDAHINDPFGLMKVKDEHYYEAIAKLIDITEKYCPGRLGLVLEGGYSFDVLRHMRSQYN